MIGALARTGVASRRTQVCERLYEGVGNTSVMEITVGFDESWPHGGAAEAPGMPRICTATTSNFRAFAVGCKVKQVYLLPDVSVRFKGLFVAVPQIATNGFDAVPAAPHSADHDDRAARCARWVVTRKPDRDE